MNKNNVKSFQVIITVQSPMGIIQVILVSTLVFFEFWERKKANLAIHRITHRLEIHRVI
jgi:predicted cation transporter